MRSDRYNIRRLSALLCALALIAAISGQSASATFSSSYMDIGSVTININASDSLRQISPYIYGMNTEAGISGVSINAVKQSDPGVSSYNWENNYSNLGSGNGSENSRYLVDSYPQSRWGTPALYTENLVTRAERYGIASRYVILQMMGKVAPGTAGSPWETVMFEKNDSYLSEPDTEDGIVYMDEYVSFLANKYGYAIDGGINGYFLDNEPENWSVRFPEAVPSPITAEELVTRSAELAYSVKKIDPTALVYGPSVGGIDAFINIKNPSDWEQYSDEYSWFIDYYLASMKNASVQRNTRLLDVLDVHYHTEATNGLLQPIIDNNDNLSNNARLQAPRILWDSSYTENSATAIMHNQHIPLIPTLKASIDMYYPGTRLSFSEYNFGGGGSISGGIAAADALGIFASYGVHMACMKPNSTDISYMKSAINIYTDYDGNGSGFGNTLVRADNGRDVMNSVYAAVDNGDENTLKAVIINKNQLSVKTADINITSGVEFTGAEVYRFGEESPEIIKEEDIENIKDNSFKFEMKPLSVYLLVFDSAENNILHEDDNNETGISGSESNGSNTGTESSGQISTTTQVPEHVDAVTYSSAGTSAPVTDNDETLPSGDTALTEATTDVILTAYVPNDDDLPNEDEKKERKVPAAVKTVVSVLVIAVVVSMFYILISDYISSRKRKS